MLDCDRDNNDNERSNVDNIVEDAYQTPSSVKEIQ